MTTSEIAGEYLNPGVAASALRLVLDAEGDARLDKWRDLGGKWATLRSGRFRLSGDVVSTTFRDLDWCHTSFAQDGELHVRRVVPAWPRAGVGPASRFVLVPSDTVEEFDELLEANPPGLDRLEESFLALDLFIQQQ
jgi:hypothetical protein